MQIKTVDYIPSAIEALQNHTPKQEKPTNPRERWTFLLLCVYENLRKFNRKNNGKRYQIKFQ